MMGTIGWHPAQYVCIYSPGSPAEWRWWHWSEGDAQGPVAAPSGLSLLHHFPRFILFSNYFPNLILQLDHSTNYIFCQDCQITGINVDLNTKAPQSALRKINICVKRTNPFYAF
jgi:hypothetical protein